MAVLRAKRLWAVTLGPVDLVDVDRPAATPIDRDSGVPFARTLIYQVPAGHRAIIRTMTHTLGGALTTGANNETFYVSLEPYNSGLMVDIHWFWWWDFRAGWPNPIQFTYDTWNGQMVLHELDKVYVWNLAAVTLHTAGSGHEMLQT